MPGGTSQKALTAYDQVGGLPAVRRTVDRFYDLMGSDPQFADLRRLHAADLGPMRDSLTGFLAAWLGGPQDWFGEHPGKCMMSVHRDVSVTEQTADQWARAMTRAIADCVDDKEVAAKMAEALSKMTMMMAAA